MKFKVDFANGRCTTISCDSNEEAKKELLSVQKRFNSKISSVNDQPIEKLALGGVLLATILGGILGNQVAKSGVSKTAKTIKSTTKKTISKTKKEFSEFRSASSKSKKYATGGGIPSDYMYKEVYDYIIGGDRPKSMATLKKLTEAKAKKMSLEYGQNLSINELFQDSENVKASSDNYRYAKGGTVKTDYKGYNLETTIQPSGATTTIALLDGAYKFGTFATGKENLNSIEKMHDKIRKNNKSSFAKGGKIGDEVYAYFTHNYMGYQLVESPAMGEVYDGKIIDVITENNTKKYVLKFENGETKKISESLFNDYIFQNKFAMGGMPPQLAIADQISQRLPATTAAIDRKFAERVNPTRPSMWEDRGLQKMATGGGVGMTKSIGLLYDKTRKASKETGDVVYLSSENINLDGYNNLKPYSVKASDNEITMGFSIPNQQTMVYFSNETTKKNIDRTSFEKYNGSINIAEPLTEKTATDILKQVDFFKKYATGGTIGQEITFKHWTGDIRNGVIKEDLGKGNFEVSSGFGNVLVNAEDFISPAQKMAKGGYTTPSYNIKTTGVYRFTTKDKTYILKSYLFERQNDTEDFIQIQDELRDELGAIIIKNSVWSRLSKGFPVRGISSKGNITGTLTRIADTIDANKYAKGGSTNERNFVNKSEDYEVRYARKNNPSRVGYKGNTKFKTGGSVENYKIVAFEEDPDYNYYVVDEDEDNYLTVQNDMFNKWKNANKFDRATYYSEWIPKSEMVVIKKMKTGGGIDSISQAELEQVFNLIYNEIKKTSIPIDMTLDKSWIYNDVQHFGDITIYTGDESDFDEYTKRKPTGSFEKIYNLVHSLNINPIIKNKHIIFSPEDGLDRNEKMDNYDKHRRINGGVSAWMNPEKYELGGGIDLFEDYDKAPPAVAKLMEKYEETFEDGDYEKLAEAHKAFEKIGYTFDYYLDGVAYDLRPIGTKGKAE